MPTFQTPSPTPVLMREAFSDLVAAGQQLPDGVLHKQFIAEIKQLEPDAGSRTRQFIISTGAIDRDNDTIDPAGWHLDNYRANPVVLWAHDYSSLPVGKCTDVHMESGKLVATAEFATHPMAETVLNLIDGGFMKATSVGFRPIAAQQATDRDGLDFTEQELLEFSIVPVPANPQALIIARSKGINMEPVLTWARKTIQSSGAFVKGVSPKDVSLSKAPEGAAWSAPALSDLASDTWENLTDAQKRKIAGHFAWADALPPTTFGGCKLPHHNAAGAIVWRGVAAAAARMNQASIPTGDMGAVKAHLGRHYKAFGKTPPWEAQASAWDDYLTASINVPFFGLPKLLRARGFLDEAVAVDSLRQRSIPPGAPDADTVAPAGQATGQDGDVPPASQAPLNTELCPACGSEYDGDICPGCGWVAPADDDGDSDETHPMTTPNVGGGAGNRSYSQGLAYVSKRLAQPKQAMRGYSVAGKLDGEDPLRWNRQLSKGFDVAGEPLEPSRLEYAWASRYLEVPVQAMTESTHFIPSARMGSFLAALDETVSGWKVDALRNMTETGREVPPVYEQMQLNSTQHRNFLVQGMRFLRRDSDGAKLVGKMAPTWSGIYLTTYARREQGAVADAFVASTWQRATQLNFLKGEAFTLSGEFLDRGDLDWKDIFLEAKQEKVLRRIVERVNEQGAEMESRGLMIMGPPGTGKTLGARVMMRQADTTFIWVSARDFYRMSAYGAFTYAFDLAGECAPSILCFEDVDNWLQGSVIDLLKTEMDGMKRRKGIQTIMTTNFPELVPDALIDRPGRFDELMEIDLPTEAVRARMLRAWLPEAPELSVTAAAKETTGYSGAHIRELTKFARTIAAEEMSALDEALLRALEKIKEQRDLVASLRQSPDYRPGRQVRMLVGRTKALVAKRGRVLSSVNEGKLRQACDHMDAAQIHMDAVLGQLDAQPPASSEPDGNEGGKFALVLVDDNVPAIRQDDGAIVLRLTADDDSSATSDDIRDAIRAAIANAVSDLGPMVLAETADALRRARGRVD